MKKVIYLVLAAVLIFVSLFVLLLYYTQDFREEFDFVDSIHYEDIEIQTSQGKGYNSASDEVYLQSAKVKIGELKLESYGYFTQKYNFPLLIGCLNLFDNIKENSLLRNNNKFNFNIEFYGSGGSYGNDNYGYSNDMIEMKVNEEKEFDVYGVYNSYNLPLKEFSKEKIKGISIYRIPEKSSNPLAEDYDYYNYNYRTDCINVNPEFKIKTIKMDFD